jgi:hypothetical protein
MLTEEDERLLDTAWAEIRRRPLQVFDRTLPALPDSEGEPRTHSDGKARHMPADDRVAASAKPA